MDLQIFGASDMKLSHHSDGARNLYTSVLRYHIRYRHVPFLNATSKETWDICSSEKFVENVDVLKERSQHNTRSFKLLYNTLKLEI